MLQAPCVEIAVSRVTAGEKAFGAAECRPRVTRWRRWVFEVSAPADEFQREVQRALVERGVAVQPATHFDFVARAFGVRAYAKLAWSDAGLEMLVKLKSGLFSSAPALERVLLEAGREAQAKLGYRAPTGPEGPP